MAKFQKTSMDEGQNKIARFIRLDQLLRSNEGLTLKGIMNDDQMDNISKRLLQDNLKELETRYGAEYEHNLYRGRERLWRYKDTNFSILKQTSVDMEIIRKSIENLSIFKGDPRYDMLRFYLIGLQKGMSNFGVDHMSFDTNNDATGLEFIELILDAIINQYPLKMIYKPFSKPAFEVHLHPYHLRQYNKRWFVFGYVEKKERVLNYALDRISDLHHLSKKYIKTDIDFLEYFDDIVGVSIYPNSEVEKVVLKIDNKSIDYIRTKPLHWSQTELGDRCSNDFTVVQLKVKINTELMMLLFSYSDAIEVLEPESLRRSFADSVRKMYQFYEV